MHPPRIFEPQGSLFQDSTPKNFERQGILLYNRGMLRKIFKTGHSAAVTLSANLLKDLGLKVGDSVKVETDPGKTAITIRHGKKQDQLALGLKVRPKL